MTDDPSETGRFTQGEVADEPPTNPFETIPAETVGLPPQRIDTRDLPAKLREAIDQRNDREGFRGYAVELANMPQDVPDGWLYIAVYGGAAYDLATTYGVALEPLASFPSRIWEPDACPLCASGVPLNR